MASYRSIIILLLVTAGLFAGLAWWLEVRDTTPELLLTDTTTGEQKTLEAPLTPEEHDVMNPVITNDMNPTAVITTNKGVIELELFADVMPVTTGNFIKLAEEGYYDNTKFHRIIDNFMIQGGDPNTKTANEASYGTGGPGYTIEDEFVAGDELSNTRGTIAMANTGQPNSGGSQFFINLVDNTGLDFDKPPFTSKHPVFGRVTSGMDVVDAIAKVDTKERDIPVEPVVIESVRIETKG
ncbi:peptidylprolyl isomerase [Candidatus Kaiserbacteria bacterium]|nr:peptidylprolyl isomerase [Candidatus Kaiserbacteria bacterium]MCB9811795.1 peptidylprolyl isomerase [Candidatus Nomurabacteria bacterium]